MLNGDWLILPSFDGLTFEKTNRRDKTRTDRS
jgi:hypothetical protein